MATQTQRVGVVGHSQFYAGADLGNQNAGFHNSLYRGKKLGTSVSAEQYAQISAGTFDDMFIGDYWEINSVIWRIAAFDYWLHDGDTECTAHHVLIVPDSALATAKMNNSNVTTGGYVGSDYYTGNNSNTGKATCKTAIEGAFGSAHILSHRELLTNAVTNGAASGWAWYDSTFEIMNEFMVYGGKAWSNSGGAGNGYDVGIDKSQLPLFAFRPDLLTTRAYWWLRGVVSATTFADVSDGGRAANNGASDSCGVRPVAAVG